MEAKVENCGLVTQRKSLEDVEPIWIVRWLLRKYFEWRGFACRSHCGDCDGSCYASIEYRGAYEYEADAYWAANAHGFEVKPIPLIRAATIDGLLPEQTVSYGVGDAPHSEASQFYRKGVPLPFDAVPRKELNRLREKIRDTDYIVEQFKTKTA